MRSTLLTTAAIAICLSGCGEGFHVKANVFAPVCSDTFASNYKAVEIAREAFEKDKTAEHLTTLEIACDKLRESAEGIELCQNKAEDQSTVILSTEKARPLCATRGLEVRRSEKPVGEETRPQTPAAPGADAPAPSEKPEPPAPTRFDSRLLKEIEPTDLTFEAVEIETLNGATQEANVFSFKVVIDGSVVDLLNDGLDERVNCFMAVDEGSRKIEATPLVVRRITEKFEVNFNSNLTKIEFKSPEHAQVWCFTPERTSMTIGKLRKTFGALAKVNYGQ